MLLRRLLTIIVFLLFAYCKVFASSYDDMLKHLYSLYNKNLTKGGFISNDSIFSYCPQLKLKAIQSNDYRAAFTIDQIAVNHLCLKGDIGLAIDEAQKMYKEASKTENKEAIALSIQAIGSVYLHSNQFLKAYSTFKEAETAISKIDNNLYYLRLLSQQMYVCFNLKDSLELEKYIKKSIAVLNKEKRPEKKDFQFSLLFYETLYHILTKDVLNTEKKIKEINVLHLNEELFYHLYNYTILQYYILINEYDSAITLLDTIIINSQKVNNELECKEAMLRKGHLLEKAERYEEACATYEQAKIQIDALDILKYSRQIEELRSSYYVDRIKIENITAHNRLVIQVIILSIIVIVVSSILIIIIIRRNAQLEKSKLELSKIKELASNAIHNKSLFLSNMSHDLRTPLNAIKGFTNLLTDTDNLDEETKLICSDNIRQGSDLLLKLFNDITDLSALNENKMSFIFQPCNIVPLCKNVIGTVNAVKEGVVELSFIPNIQSLNMVTDSGRLQQVLINLLVNSTKFTHSGTIKLFLDIDTKKNEAIFTVEDTGCGIPLEKQPTIFERFEKLHESKQGVGLGLSICHLIIERFGGNIWIDPTYTQGARFIFTHPLTITNKE